jgi:four helix bundle protein
MKARSYEDLVVWQKAHALTNTIYKITEDFPSTEKFTLVKQIRGSAISVPANIAEGFGRFHQKEKIQFYNIAIGSLNETENYLKQIKGIGLTDIGNLLESCIEIRKMLCGYIKAIRNTPQY